MANENPGVSYTVIFVGFSRCVFLYCNQLDKQCQILDIGFSRNTYSNEGVLSKFYKVTVTKRSVQRNPVYRRVIMLWGSNFFHSSLQQLKMD
jgi:hypothetical protein